MDVRAALVGISGRQLHGLRLDQSQFSHPGRHYLSIWLWLQYQNDRDHCPGRRELQIQLGQGALLSSLSQREPTGPRAELGVFLLKRDGIFGETVARRSFCFHENSYVAGCPLLALSGHAELHCTCPLLGVKRTCRFALQMSAYDPKRTCHRATEIGIMIARC